MSDVDVVIVGGGASGMLAAHYLRNLGLVVHTLEQGPRLGGRIGDALLGARRIDLGGKNIGKQYTHFRAFVRAHVSAVYEEFGVNTSLRLGTRVLAIDGKKRLESAWKLLRLAGFRDFGRLAALASKLRKDPDQGFLGSRVSQELCERFDTMTLAELFDPECCMRVLRPLTVRMNGAEPDEYQVGNLAPNLRMALDQYEQLTSGLHAVVDVFLTRHTVTTGAEVSGFLWRGTQVTGVRFRHDGQDRTLSCRGVVLATPAHQAARLLEPFSSELADALRQVRYHPVAVAVAEYEHDVFSPDVRAAVFEPTSVISNAGAYGVRDLATVRYTFSGLGSRPLLESHAAPERAIALAEAALSERLGKSLGARRALVHRQWDQGLCSYAPRHDRLRACIERSLRGARLTLAGDYLRGASLEACARAAAEAASGLERQLSSALPELVANG